MEKTVRIEDLEELRKKAQEGDEESIISYAEKILYYSNEIVSDPFLSAYIDRYALDMLSPLADKGNQEASDILKDYFFTDDEYRE